MEVRPLTLSIETATMAGSIAIAKGNEILATASGDASLSHSNTLLADIDLLLAKVNLKIQDVDLFAVASGPGSFTGLRIGIATVKALSETLGRPCVGVPTLKAIAYAAGPGEKIVAVLPAGRGEVFAQMFSVSPSGVVAELDSAVHVSPARLAARYQKCEAICWTGEGADAYLNVIAETAANAGYDFFYPGEEDSSLPGSAWRMVESRFYLAESIAWLASAEPVESHRAIDLRAIYVRPSDAEMKL